MLSFPPSPQLKILDCRQPVDMRKSVPGHAGAVSDIVDHDPRSGQVSVFFKSQRSVRKALVSGSHPADPIPRATLPRSAS